ncbi:uncharacterized protein G6M90_00g021210 [Metarhizium brunneum]|uniref:Uncharacterized protein n=1 Tax=Metarhizium brunneum TaxID=500148 RepID=A0A7D5Z0W9_9HYPO
MDFDPELDLAVHKEQIRAKRDPDLTKVWLPVSRVDEAKDEGLQFPPRARRLAQLLWHQLENERTTTDADERYLDEIRQEADRVVESFSKTSFPVLPSLDENFVELAAVPTLSQQDRESSYDAESFVSVIDPTSEPDCIKLRQHDFAVSATDPYTDTNTLIYSPSQMLPTNGSELCYEASEDSHKQDSEVFRSPRIRNSFSLSPYRCCSDDSKSCSFQEPHDKVKESLVAVVSDEIPEKESPEQESVELSVSKYFVQNAASDTTHETPELPRLETRLRNRGGSMVNKGLGWSFSQKGTTEERVAGIQAQAATRNFLELSKESIQERSSSKNSYNTGNLLDQFMQMRGIRNSRAITSDNGPPSISSHPKARNPDQELAKMQTNTNIEKSPDQQPALAPRMMTLQKPGCCLISLQLGYSMIKNLEKAWPANKLVDRDYARHLRLPDQYTCGNNTASFISHAHEVDVSLTPNDGIVVTTLLQVKQKQLPGSKILTSLRQRILSLSQQYRTLIVFVSEANTAGEYMTELPTSDLAAYADFVCFVSHLAADISVYLVPGADKTLSSWILSAMAHYNPQMTHLEDSMAFCNTKWELFFRRSGMNVRASLVLSHVLFKEFGSSGLASFLRMTTEQQMTKYGVPLGLEEHISRAGRIWDTDDKKI